MEKIDPMHFDTVVPIAEEVIFEGQPEREKKVMAERNEIEAAVDYEQVLRIARRNADPLNQRILVNKAMQFEDKIIQEIVKRLKTSLNIGFIETSIRILLRSEKNVAEELIGYFDEIRNPYAQSMVLILLGFKAAESHIPWVIEKYKELKKLYPDESYCEGAYYALSEMARRFYAEDNTRYEKR
jgi:hypothetical protein